jgi:hypothetical protein
VVNAMADETKTHFWTKRTFIGRLRLLILLAVLAAVSLWAYFSTRDPINWTLYSRIKNGMSGQEVLAVLGCPPGVYGEGGNHLEDSSRLLEPSYKIQEWRGFEHSIFIFYNEQGLVNGKTLYVAWQLSKDTPFLERLYWRMGIRPPQVRE